MNDPEIVRYDNAVGHAHHVAHYCYIVAKLFYERGINRECARMIESKDPSNVETISELVRARDAVGTSQAEPLTEVLHRATSEIGKTEKKKLYTIGIPTFDRLWSGCAPGEITTWGGAPGVGKSLLMVNILRHCHEQGWPTLLVGTEMSNDEQSARIISVFGGPAAISIRRGLSGPDWQRYLVVADEISGSKITLMDKPEPSLDDIEAAVVESKPAVLIVDYLTHCRLPALSKMDPMRLRVAEFLRRLHSLARRHDVTVHLTSQLNRMSYKEHQPPTMGELAESAAVEQESSRVVLLWEPPPDKDDPPPDGVRFLEAINCKSRHSQRKIKLPLMLAEDSLRITEEICSGHPEQADLRAGVD